MISILEMIVWSLLLLTPFLTHGLQYRNRLKKIDQNSKFKKVIETLNVSIHTHVALVYFIYTSVLLLASFDFFSVKLMVVTQVFLTLMILNFLSFLLRPFSSALSVLPKVQLNGHEAYIARRNVLTRFRDSQDIILGELTKYFFNLRMEVYSGLSEHEDDRSILYYMRYRRHDQGKVVSRMKNSLMHFDPIVTSKTLFLMVILLFFSVNYTLLYNGIASGFLVFSQPLTGLLAPLYYLMSTFSTVGYGDVTPLFGLTQIYTLSLLLNTVLILLIIVNVIQDFSLNAAEKILTPFREFQDLLTEETNRIIYLLEVKRMEEEAIELVYKYKKYPELSLLIESYVNRCYFNKKKEVEKLKSQNK